MTPETRQEIEKLIAEAKHAEEELQAAAPGWPNIDATLSAGRLADVHEALQRRTEADRKVLEALRGAMRS